MGSDSKVVKSTAGRPPKLPAPDAVERIRKLAEAGTSKVKIAKALGANYRTLCKWFELDETLAEAFEEGRKTEEDEMVEIIKSNARDGDKPNINAMFILKTRHGYREGESQNTTNRVNIVFNIPAAQSPEDYMKKVLPSG